MLRREFLKSAAALIASVNLPDVNLPASFNSENSKIAIVTIRLEALDGLINHLMDSGHDVLLTSYPPYSDLGNGRFIYTILKFPKDLDIDALSSDDVDRYHAALSKIEVDWITYEQA